MSSIRTESKNVKSVFLNPYFGTSTFLITKKLISKLGGFNETLDTAEDLELYLRVSTLAKIGKIHEELVWKSSTEASLGNRITSYSENLRVVDAFLKTNASMSSMLSSATLTVKARIYKNWGKDLLWRNQPIKALCVFWRGQKILYSFEVTVLCMKCIVKWFLLKIRVGSVRH